MVSAFDFVEFVERCKPSEFISLVEYNGSLVIVDDMQIYLTMC